jgi:hypothetical protein
MAIGVRITSDNLNGKTATVTFVPAAGSPDGTGSVNLGTKTIPFNNIDTFPYGTYSLTFPEYDYTYTLEVPVPVDGVQAFVSVAPMVGATGNYGASFLNFNDLTVEVMDLGVNTEDWWVDNIQPLQDSGYAYHFQGADNFNVRKVIFTNKNGESIGEFTNLDSSWNYDLLDGKIALVDNYDIGEVYYSDGVEVFTYTYDPEIYDFDFDWNEYAVTKDGSMIFYITNMDTSEVKCYNVLGSAVTEIESFYWESGIDKIFYLTPSYTFYPCMTRESNSTYSEIKFRNTSGVQVGLTVDLTEYNYNNYNWQTYGDNKFVILLWDQNNPAIPYRIVHFDGNTNVLTETTHERGTNFPNYEIVADETFTPGNDDDVSLAIFFFKSLGYSNFGTTVNYMDIVYMFSNQTSFSTHSFLNNTTKEVCWDATSDRIDLIHFEDGEDTYAQLTSITSTNVLNTSTGIAATVNSEVEQYMLGQLGTITLISTSDTDGALINSRTPGAISHSTEFSLMEPYYYNMVLTNNIFYIKGAYINLTSNGFQETSEFSDNYQSYYQTGTGLENSFVALYNTDTRGLRVLTGTTISDEIILPMNNDYYTLRAGKDHVMYAYLDSENSDLFTIELYNSDLEKVNSVVTQYTNIEWESYGIKDRYVISFTTNTRLITYLVSPTTILNTIQGNGSSDRELNDYIWWND